MFDKRAYTVSSVYNDLLTRDPLAPINDPIDALIKSSPSAFVSLIRIVIVKTE